MLQVCWYLLWRDWRILQLCLPIHVQESKKQSTQQIREVASTQGEVVQKLMEAAEKRDALLKAAHVRTGTGLAAAWAWPAWERLGGQHRLRLGCQQRQG